MRILADVNVWLATVHEGHPHHAAAINWWRDGVIGGGHGVAFCRITQLGLLRLLSNELVMGASRLDPDRAWSHYRRILAQRPVGFVAEPEGVDVVLAEMTRGRVASAGLWTDAYLAAFARAGDLELATFDRGFRRFPGLRLDLLNP